MTQRKQEGKPHNIELTVAVVAYGSNGTLRGCLEHLARQTYAGFETLVIDNASPERSGRDAILALPASRLIENLENRGFAAACNQGARVAQGRTVLPQRAGHERQQDA